MTEPLLDESPPYPSAFALPPYEIATSLDTWADSYCLPPYQFRTARRFHPYMRILPSRRARREESFEEFLRSLPASTNYRATAPSVAAAEASSVASTPPCPPTCSTNRQVPAPLPIATALPAPGPPPPAPRLLAQDPDVDPVERRLSLVYRLFLLPDIIRIVRAGLRAAMRAAEVQKRKMVPEARS